jgi:hypothetical protein
MSTKHSAILPDGTVATRKSENNVYPFLVAVGPAPKAEVIAGLHADIDYQSKLAARYTVAADYAEAGRSMKLRAARYTPKADEGSWIATEAEARAELGQDVELGRQYTYTGQITVSDIVVDGTEASARAAIVTTYRGYAAGCVERVANRKQAIADAEAGPDLVGSWRVSGWQSRSDLAAKQRDKMRRSFPAREVVVITATIAK